MYFSFVLIRPPILEPLARRNYVTLLAQLRYTQIQIMEILFTRQVKKKRIPQCGFV